MFAPPSDLISKKEKIHLIICKKFTQFKIRAMEAEHQNQPSEKPDKITAKKEAEEKPLFWSCLLNLA